MRDDFRLVAKIYDRIIKPRQDISWRKIICELESSSLLLDVGGGTGRIADTMDNCFERIVIYDVSLPMIRESKNKNGKIFGICGKVENLAMRNNYFDAVIMVDTLHHVENHQKAIFSILNVLRPGGTFILEEPDIRKFPVKLIAVMEKLLFMRSHFLKPEVVLNWIDTNNFTVNLIEEDNNYYFIIKKIIPEV
jgi:demethylmenaquinone methyltransferase/2-methoxy-6-polyprenyl-1,4-benzoquinol methylase